MTTLYFDGSNETFGFLLEGNTVYKHDTFPLPQDVKQTHNVAEYMALISGLKAAVRMGISELTIIGDSQLIINQVMGKARCSAPHLKPLRQEVLDLLDLMPSYKLQWRSRKHNKADGFSRFDI